MPTREYKKVDATVITTVKPVSGYEWLRNKFGPLPGIPKREKQVLDDLPDHEYVEAYLKRRKSEIRSLMISETERRRSFRNNWLYENIVKGEKLGKAGFYFLNSKDRVKCVFCCGVVDSWSQGDDPMERHRRHFSFCTFVQGKNHNNIPFDEVGLGSLLIVKRNGAYDRRYQDARPEDLFDILMKSRPCHPAYLTHKSRKEKLREFWPAELHGTIPIACDAGFYGTGPDDRCVCFYCGGTLEDWAVEDNPWVEHAKWYFKCPYLIRSKGGDFIRSVRVKMSPQDRHESENLRYGVTRNEGDDDFEEIRERTSSVRNYSLFNIVNRFGYSEDIIIKAYQKNKWKEYENPEDVLQCIYEIEDSEHTPTDATSEQREKYAEVLTIGELNKYVGQDDLTHEQKSKVAEKNYSSQSRAN